MTRSPVRLLGGLLATLLVGVGAVVATAPAASAAACDQGTGVTVVVDGNQLGGLSTTCVPGGGRSATSAFSAAGVSMSYAARQAGFVCKVQGKPSNAGCVNASPANAYWSLWWSDGKGSWNFASVGVGSLSVPKGGWVAWSWQGQSAKAQPGVAPVGKAPAPAPAPVQKPTQKAPAAAPSAASPSAKASAKAEKKARAEKKVEVEASKKAEREREATAATPSAAADDADVASDEQTRAASADAGSPWPTVVGLVAVLALLGAAGFVAWRRRGNAL